MNPDITSKVGFYAEKRGADEILDGMHTILLHLKKNNILFSLGSASKNARLILKQLKLIDLFDAIVDGNDVSKAKPDPEVFLIAAQKLGVDPEDCIVIEDAIAGIETPVIEVHISNTYSREAFRHKSFIAPNARGIIIGFGLKSYELAINSLI